MSSPKEAENGDTDTMIYPLGGREAPYEMGAALRAAGAMPI